MTLSRDQKIKKFALIHYALLEAAQLLNTAPRDVDGLALSLRDAERIDMLLDTADRVIDELKGPGDGVRPTRQLAVVCL